MLRAKGGWQLIGTVDLTDPDLKLILIKLRETAIERSLGDFQTKIIIPNEKIQYLSIKTGLPKSADQRPAVRQALTDLASYSIEALQYDYSTDEGETHIAAVTRETLLEAETFATEHGFNPISFVAVPESNSFIGEPFFGLSSQSYTILQKNEKLEPDSMPVKVIGDASAQAWQNKEKKVVELDNQKAAKSKTSNKTKSNQVSSKNFKKITISQPHDFISTYVEPEDEDQALDKVKNKKTKNHNDPKSAQSESNAKNEQAGSVSFNSRRTSEKSNIRSLDKGSSTVLSSALVKTTPLLPAPLHKRVAEKKVGEQITTEPDILTREQTEIAERNITHTGQFSSQRKAPKKASSNKLNRINHSDTLSANELEAQRLTIFGARNAPKKAIKKQYLSFLIIVTFFLSLIGMIAFASIIFDDDILRFFQRQERTLASTLPVNSPLKNEVGSTTNIPKDITSYEIEGDAVNEVVEPDFTSGNNAMLDASQDLRPNPINTQNTLDNNALEARYAVTGVWPKAPEAISPSTLIPLDNFYIPGIDPVSPALDAVALPSITSFQTDNQLAGITSPVAAGTNFILGPDGLIVATIEGALSPDGYTIILGQPSVVPPAIPIRLSITSNDTDTLEKSTNIRPRLRPTDLIEQNERAALGGLSRSELAGLRPRLRPEEMQKKVELQREGDEVKEVLPIALAAPKSIRPALRPKNFAQVVDRAKQSTSATPTITSTVTSTVSPSIPSSASVSREATTRNAINLKKVNLIGVYGKPSNRRALVRLSNGRFRKVKVGDRIDGGRVSAIGDSELRYKKGSRNLVLKMPKS